MTPSHFDRLWAWLQPRLPRVVSGERWLRIRTALDAYPRMIDAIQADYQQELHDQAERAQRRYDNLMHESARQLAAEKEETRRAKATIRRPSNRELGMFRANPNMTAVERY